MFSWLIHALFYREGSGLHEVHGLVVEEVRGPPGVPALPVSPY